MQEIHKKTLLQTTAFYECDLIKIGNLLGQKHACLAILVVKHLLNQLKISSCMQDDYLKRVKT